MSARDRGAGSADAEPAPIAYLPWVQHGETEPVAISPLAPPLGEYQQPELSRRDFGAETEFSVPPSEPALEAIVHEIEAADRADALVLKKLARHGLSEHEVRQQLRSELVEADVEAAVERYLRLGYIDDERLTEALVRSATQRKSLGPSAIKRELVVRGIDPELIARALADIDAETELEQAVELIQRKAERSSDSKVVLERRLLAQLQRKGYASSIARRAVEQVLSSET